MDDDLEQEGGEGRDLEFYLGVIRRRHLPFAIAVLLGWALVWGASWLLAPRYQSSTLILVEQPTLAKDYVTPNVGEDLQERMQSITQQILSRTRLLHIIDEFKLYPGKHAQRSADEKVESMRKDIAIELVRDPRNQITAFNVSYSSGDPHIAQQVTTELTHLFINENLEVRQQQSQDTTQFLEAQLEGARKSLAEQEDKVRQFKAQHPGELPSQLAANLQILSGLQSQLQNEEDALNSAKQQHVYLESLVNQYRALQGSAKGPDAAAVGLPAIDEELEKLRAQLTDLSSRYTDRYPDVRKLREQIAKTESIREQLLASLKAKPSDASAAGSTPPAGAGDANQASMLAQVQSQLQSNQLEITDREHSVAALKANMDAYQGRLNQEPVREQQLADLTRGYDQSKATYDELLKKKNESKMATSMELLQQGEQFHIIDPPSFPQRPVFPNHLKFCALGFGIGLGLGLVVVVIFETFDERLYSGKEIKKLLPVEVIGEIPAIVNPADARIAKRKASFAWAADALVLAVILAGSAFSYLHG
jgi:polysaccharide biosynthesis transport protein